ncbi:MAG: universal stress protein, partial [Oligoflexia bacterium]|nr:universal stress protein [Oligoflexia bacterium]
MFPTLLVILFMDDRDVAVLDAVVAGAAAMGTRHIVVAHIFKEAPLQSPLSALLQQVDHTMPPELGEASEDLSQRLPGIDVSSISATGVPETEIARLVDQHDVDLVVLGRRPAVGDKPGWGASDSKLLRLAPCSVMVVPSGSQLGLGRA